jgi:predicted MPP superfamily phosphohydrolase
MIWLVAALVAAALAILAWGWFEAGWLRRRVLEVEIAGLPPALDGVRIGHLTDFHLGVAGRGKRAVEEGVRWVAERRPDLVCVTGDLVSRRSGAPDAERLLRELGPSFVVLGNHDLDDTRDPFSQRFDPSVLAAVEGLKLLADEACNLDLRGVRVQIVGVEPSSYARRAAQPHELVDARAPFRILLCHFPRVVHRLPPGTFHLVLAGHLHAGQIVLPFPGGKFRFAHPRAGEVEGIYRFDSTVLHVSPGLGTTFVPFRFFARPEVTELVLRCSA